MNDLARRLRRDQTDTGKRLWYHLKHRGLGGGRLRRQHPVGPYVVDFVCIEARLIVEPDGGQHAERAAADRQRTAHLESLGYRLLRFWNNEARADTQAASAAILEALAIWPAGEGVRHHP
jgi:very-short-patch-repair endonuclease